MEWDKVGKWLKENAADGAALVGSLLTGNIQGAVAAGVAMVSSATGTTDPDKALDKLKLDPASLIKLKELAIQEEANIREHIRAITEMGLKDAQAEHHETQETIRSGDNAEDAFVRRTRPAQSWVSLLAALIYAFVNASPNLEILIALLTLPWAYAGLRQVGKGIDAWVGSKK